VAVEQVELSCEGIGGEVELVRGAATYPVVDQQGRTGGRRLPLCSGQGGLDG
jgi:hypothetical protein